MHWRIFGFARKLHLTLKQSDALAIFESPTQTRRLSRCLGYRCSDKVLIEVTQADRQINMLAGRRDVRNLCAGCRVCRLKISTAVRSLTD